MAEAPFYIETGTGKRLAKGDVFDPTRQYVEAGTGRMLQGTEIEGIAGNVARVENQGKPGYDVFGVPIQSPDGAVSSSDISTTMSANQALMGAAAPLTMPDFSAEIAAREARTTERLDKYLGALKGTYDAALAADNAKYADMFASLASSHENARQAAIALAASINPYSSERTSSTTGGYLQTIDAKYQGQAQSLKRQMEAAQELMRANNYEAATKLILDAEKEMNDFEMDMRKYALDIYSEQRRGFESDRAFEFGMEQEQNRSAEFAARLGLDYAKLEQDREMDEYQKRYIEAQIADIYSNITSRETKDSTGSVQYTLPKLTSSDTNIIFTPRADLTAAQRTAASNLVNAVSFLNEGEALYAMAAGDEYEGIGRTTYSRLKGLARIVGKGTGLAIESPEAWTSYSDFVKARRALIAKGIMGEAGNLAQTEQLNAAIALPNEFSTPEEGREKFRTLRLQLLDQARAFGDVVETNGQTTSPVGDTSSWKNPDGTYSLSYQGQIIKYPTVEALQEARKLITGE